MAKLTKPMNKISQRSIGFNLRQIIFFAEHPAFKPDQYCRRAVDDQIAQINPKYLDDRDPRK